MIAGAGSAGYGIFRILKEAGCRNIIVTDSMGAIYENRIKGINSRYKKEIADKTNPMKLSGSLADVLKGDDVFIGVSGRARLIDKEMVQSMNSSPIVFALSNPTRKYFHQMHWKQEQALLLQVDQILQIK